MTKTFENLVENSWIVAAVYNSTSHVFTLLVCQYECVCRYCDSSQEDITVNTPDMRLILGWDNILAMFPTESAAQKWLFDHLGCKSKTAATYTNYGEGSITSDAKED